MTNLNEITYVDWQLKLNAIGGVAEGAFGSDIYKYIDYPINEATPNIVREATDAITMWETRIKINSIEVEIEESTLTVKVEWTLKDSNANGVAEVSYDTTA